MCLLMDMDCFNLVIEMLFFSSTEESIDDGLTDAAFQSRNRDAFLFKEIETDTPRAGRRFQSRNRDAFLFKLYYIHTK